MGSSETLKSSLSGERIFASIRVEGRVQGVGYRYYALHLARRLELTGWVANAGDGSVHLEVEGPRSAVNELVMELRRGPITARVREVHVEEGPYQSRFHSFQVESDRYA